MYKSIIRPILFLLSPEKVHHLVVAILKFAALMPGLKSILNIFFKYSSEKLKTDFVGIRFPNKVGLAAGFDKNGDFYDEFSVFGFGHIEIGTVTPKPQPGNPKPRSFRLPKDKALINRMGFNNLGVDEAVKKLKNRKNSIIIGGNIGKNTDTPNDKAVDDYLTCFEKLYDYVDYFVVNVSCPNITNLCELQDKDALTAILKTLTICRKTKSCFKPILLKISPDLNNDQVDDTIQIVQEFGIDGFVVSNTTTTRTGLLSSKEIIKKIGRGGLSGLPIKERSTELIRYISQKTNGKLPIIGAGGILSENDALEKLKAGAGLVQIYTGFIYEGPFIVKRLNKAIDQQL